MHHHIREILFETRTFLYGIVRTIVVHQYDFVLFGWEVVFSQTFQYVVNVLVAVISADDQIGLLRGWWQIWYGFRICIGLLLENSADEISTLCQADPTYGRTIVDNGSQ